MISRKMLWCVVGVALVWGLAGCGGSEEPAAPAAKAPAAKAPAAKAPAAKAPAAKAPPAAKLVPDAVVTNDIPDTFPVDVPRYPGGNVLQGRAVGSTSVSLKLETGDSLEEVVRFYDDGLVAQDWSTDVRPSVNGTAIFADKGSRKLAISISTNQSGKTQVDLIAAEMPF